MEDSEHLQRKQIEFEERLRNARSAVQAVIVSRTPNDWDRDEIVGKTEDRIRDKMRSTNWTLEIKNVLAYEIRIAYRLIIDKRRRDGKHRHNSLDDETKPEAHERLVGDASKRRDIGLNIETKIYLEELGKIIPWEMLLKGLTQYQLGLIRMHYYDGINFRDMGDAVGEPWQVVKYKVEGAMATIRYRARCYLKERGLTSLFKREA